jgi:type II pantothenate kinase
MHIDIEFRDHWMNHFERHFKTVMRLAVEHYGPDAAPRADACYSDLVAQIRAIRARPEKLQRLDLLILDGLRQDILIAHGLPDPFETAKAQENNGCLPLYPQVVAELDSHPEHEALLLAVEGVFAGNIFDLGVSHGLEMLANKSGNFFATRNSLDGKRPWLIDHFDALARRLLQGPRHRQAMFFCDNSGPDIVLGVIPFCRWLARRGTRVLIAANRLPALNDITVSELRQLLPRLQALDPTLDALVKSGQLAAIDSGNGVPLIDLREVSDEVNRHAAQTDLLVLEGMGRAVESNLEARFKVDSLKLAMIKDEMVAKRRGGKMFDTICRFDPV